MSRRWAHPTAAVIAVLLLSAVANYTLALWMARYSRPGGRLFSGKSVNYTRRALEGEFGGEIWSELVRQAPHLQNRDDLVVISTGVEQSGFRLDGVALQTGDRAYHATACRIVSGWPFLCNVSNGFGPSMLRARTVRPWGVLPLPFVANTGAFAAPLLAALGTGVWCRRSRRVRAGHCPGCGYDMAGLPGRACPECGTEGS